MQTAPPLPLAITRLFTLPATNRHPVFNAALDVRNSGTKPIPVTLWFQPMDGLTAGTPQATQEYSFSKGGKIGEDEPVPPEGLLAARATGGLHPGEISTETRNLVDVGSNKQYQYDNSCREGYPGTEGAVGLSRDPPPCL